jgi:hypothetical protein
MTGRRTYSKNGYFVTRHNHQPVPRYRCRICGKNFSAHTARPTSRQKKPALNAGIYGLYSSGMTLRRMAKVLKVDKKTVFEAAALEAANEPVKEATTPKKKAAAEPKVEEVVAEVAADEAAPAEVAADEAAAEDVAAEVVADEAAAEEVVAEAPEAAEAVADEAVAEAAEESTEA